MEKILDWFDENYLESRKECFEILIQAQKDYSFTIEKTLTGCKIIKEALLQKHSSLVTHIFLLGNLIDTGFSASLAGETMKKLFLIQESENKTNKPFEGKILIEAILRSLNNPTKLPKLPIKLDNNENI